MKTYKQQVEDILNASDETYPAVMESFLSTIKESQTNVDMNALTAALVNKDVSAALAAIRIDDLNDLLFGIGMNKEAYVFNNQMNNIFMVGASVAVSHMSPDLQKVFSFDRLNQRAIENLRADNLRAVTGITNTTRDGIRLVIERAVESGVNPTKQAKYIRQMIGLTGPQAQAVSNFRTQLETRQQLGFTLAEDRRLNAIDQMIIDRHMRDGGLTVKQIDELVGKYHNSLLNKRAKDIARTEALNSVSKGQQEVWEQGLDQGIFDDTYRKFWIVTRDAKLRPTHSVIPGMNPNGVQIRSQFITPFGLVDNPGTANVGFINCRCCVVLGWFGQGYTKDGYIQ